MILMFIMTILLPALIGAGVILLSAVAHWAQWRRAPIDERPDVGGWPLMLAGAVGLTAAFVVSFRFSEGGWPGWPPHSRWQWVLYMAIAAGLVGAVNVLIPYRLLRPLPRAWVIGIALAVIGMLMLHPLADQSLPWAWKAGFGAAVLIMWLGLDGLARDDRPLGTESLLLALLAAFAAAAFVIVESRFAKPSQMAGAMAATCGFTLALSVILRMMRVRLPLGCGATAPLAMTLPGLLMVSWFYNASGVPAAAFALAGAGPLALWASVLPPMRRWVGWRAWSLRIVLAIILPAIAVLLTILREAPPEPSAYEW